MGKVPVSKLADRAQSVLLQYCPNCDPPTIMAIKAIRPAMCRGDDTIVYECQKCGYEKIYKLK